MLEIVSAKLGSRPTLNPTETIVGAELAETRRLEGQSVPVGGYGNSNSRVPYYYLLI